MDKPRQSFTFPENETAAVLAALAQARDCATGSLSLDTSGETRVWHMVRRDGLVTITGPFAMLSREFYQDDNGTEYLAAEIEYTDLRALQDLISDITEENH